MIAYYKVAWTMPASEDGKPLPGSQQYVVTTHSVTAADTLLELLSHCPQACGASVMAVPDTDWPF